MRIASRDNFILASNQLKKFSNNVIFVPGNHEIGTTNDKDSKLSVNIDTIKIIGIKTNIIYLSVKIGLLIKLYIIGNIYEEIKSINKSKNFLELSKNLFFNLNIKKIIVNKYIKPIIFEPKNLEK